MAIKKPSPKKSSAEKAGPDKNAGSRVDAVTLLETDHRKVRELLEELEATSERSTKRRSQLLSEIGSEIRVHAGIEEEIFYPAFHESGESKDDGKLFFEAAEEHALVDIVLQALEATEPGTDEFSAKAKVLKDLIEHHAEEEEEEMFPRAKKLLGRERLIELGAELQQRKTELAGQFRNGQNEGSRKTNGAGRSKLPTIPIAASAN